MPPTAQGLDLGILMGLAYQAFVRELNAWHVDHGFDDLGRSDGYVFRSLAAGPLTVSSLAARLGISKQGAGQIVDDMRRRGYVEQRPDPTDGRARQLALTSRGQAALAAARTFHRRFERRLAREHGKQNVTLLRAMLGAIAGETDEVAPRPPAPL
jgi:DNA-binding MarR family transcriptional regulator